MRRDRAVTLIGTALLLFCAQLWWSWLALGPTDAEFARLLAVEARSDHELVNPEAAPKHAERQSSSDSPGTLGNARQSTPDRRPKSIVADDTYSLKPSAPVPQHARAHAGLRYQPSEFPIGVVAYNRPEYLRTTLESLLSVDHVTAAQVTVYQDGDHAPTAAVAHDMGIQLHQHQRRVPVEYTEGAVFICEHYQHIFETVFLAENAPKYLIVVEDDMQFSPDFLDYFVQLAPLVDDDPSVWCITSWNDNGFAGSVADVTRIDRTEFFVGLGWMMSRDIFLNELKDKWPGTHWDHWMRQPDQRRGRECVYPEVSRNRNIGEVGTHSSAGVFQKYIARVAFANSKHARFDPIEMQSKHYEEKLRRELSRAAPVYGAKDLARMLQLANGPVVLYIAIDADTEKEKRWLFPLRLFQMWDTNPVRGYHRGLVRTTHQGKAVYLVSHRSEYAQRHMPKDYTPIRPEELSTVRMEHTPVSARLGRGRPSRMHLPREGPLYTADDLSRFQAVVAPPLASCDTACNARRLSCNRAMFGLVNTCEKMKEFFPCAGGVCRESHGYDQPAMIAASKECLLQGDDSYFKCSGVHQSTQRLCPCS